MIYQPLTRSKSIKIKCKGVYWMATLSLPQKIFTGKIFPSDPARVFTPTQVGIFLKTIFSECDSGLGSASDSGRGKSDNSDKSDKDGSSSENEKTPEEMENIKRLQSLVRKSEIVVAQPTYQQELIYNTPHPFRGTFEFFKNLLKFNF